MDFINRAITDKIEKARVGKAVVLLGARQTGKTTLLRHCLNVGNKTLWINGDHPRSAELLNFPFPADAQRVLAEHDVIVIDEAQKIASIGLIIKELVDANALRENPRRIYVTGSSALELAEGVRESALGRFFSFRLYPLSIQELVNAKSLAYVRETLDERLIYGMYPEVVLHPEEAKNLLLEHVESALFRDAQALGNLKNLKALSDLVVMLAYQVGSLVNRQNLSRELGISRFLVDRYIRLLEDCFIIKTVNSFSRNPVNELKKSQKVYFCDNGIRNAIIENFEPLQRRNDGGALWENFFFVERLKKHALLDNVTKIYFWRTPQKQEVDFVEVTGETLQAFECKLSEKSTAKVSKTFLRSYPDCQVNIATRERVDLLI